jgi:hypothetical protein
MDYHVLSVDLANSDEPGAIYIGYSYNPIPPSIKVPFGKPTSQQVHAKPLVSRTSGFPLIL